MARTDKQMNFRMPHENVDKVKIHAKNEKRSVTAELNLIIEEWLEAKERKESAKA